MSPARRAAIAAAESAGHEKITPRDPRATLEECAEWVRMRYVVAALYGPSALTNAIRAYAAEIGVKLPEVKP